MLYRAARFKSSRGLPVGITKGDLILNTFERKELMSVVGKKGRFTE